MNDADDTTTPPESESPATAAGFAQLGLKPEIVSALAQLGYEEPTKIQQSAIPPLLEGRDVLGQAATGTGKTAAFALPIVERLTPGQCKPFETSALIVVPTRELAMQVAEAIFKYGKNLGVSVLPVYGGQPIGDQLRRLKRGIDVVIATPGRALDHLRRKSLILDKVQTVVLDEADEMLDLGFADDLEELLSALPEQRQAALFSATLAPRIAAIAERHLRNPVRIKIEAQAGTPSTLPKIRQTAYIVPPAMKDLALSRVLDLEAPKNAILFCRTRVDVDRLTEVLHGHGYAAAALHGGMDQDQRQRVLKLFKAGKIELLIATDVAARGLDVEGLSHVINFDLPTAPEPYLHRIGRTGRAGREGVAISLLEPREHRLLKNIERVSRQPIEIGKLPTVVDVRARRLELTRAEVEQTLSAGELGGARAMVEQIASGGADVMDIAAAAIARLNAALHPSSPDEEQEIPAYEPRRERPERTRPGPRGHDQERGPGRPHPRAQAHAYARLFVGLGARAGLRPADLVGAIANEAGVARGEIGAIQIEESHSFVEIAKDRADEVLEVLRGTTIRGRRVTVNLDRGGAPKRFGAGPGRERPTGPGRDRDSRPTRPSRPKREE